MNSFDVTARAVLFDIAQKTKTATLILKR